MAGNPVTRRSLQSTSIYRQTWSEVRERFCELPEDSSTRDAMLALIDHISNSAVGPHLHPWTAMYDLRITQTANHPFQDVPQLVISPQIGGELEFRYIDTWKQDRQWTRLVPGQLAIERFDKFIEQLHWLEAPMPDGGD